MKILLENKQRPHPERKSMFVRKTYCRRKNGKEIITLMSYGTSGFVHYNTPEIRKHLPEEYRNDECIMIYSTFDFTEGTDPGQERYYLADQIDTYNGKYWRVIRSKRWTDFGFYQALAVRVQESFWEAERKKREKDAS